MNDGHKTQLPGGPGGGGNELEARVGRLESELSALRDGVADLRVGQARLEERVSHLPSKGFIVGIVVTALTILGTIAALAPKLLTLI